MEKIKIIHLIPTLHFGGAERLLVDIAQHHSRDRYDMTVVTLVAEGPLVDVLKESGVKYIRMQKRMVFGIDILFRLIHLFRKERPDIVHTQLFGADAWGKTAAWLTRVPVIISTEQNMWYDESWIRHQIKWILSWFSTKIIAISDAVAQYAIKDERVDPAKLVTIISGIELERFLRLKQKSFLRSKELKFLSIGRLEEQKDFDTLFAACAKIRELPWTLTIVGNGSQLAYLEERVGLLGLSQKIHFYGTTDEVEEVFVEHDVFVLSSKWEGLGLVIMEAQASAKPVIATHVGGIPELITQSQTGYLVPPSDPDALALQMADVIEQRAFAMRIGEQAREYARSHHNIKRMVMQYETLYESLVT